MIVYEKKIIMISLIITPPHFKRGGVKNAPKGSVTDRLKGEWGYRLIDSHEQGGM